MHDEFNVRRFIVNVVFDLLMLVLAFLTVSLIKFGSVWEVFPYSRYQLGVFILVYVVVSVLFRKYELRGRIGFYRLVNRYLQVWILLSAAAVILFYTTEIITVSQVFLLSSLGCIFIYELVFLLVRLALRYALLLDERREYSHQVRIENAILHEKPENLLHLPWSDLKEEEIEAAKDLNIIFEESIRKFIQRYTPEGKVKRLLLSTRRRFNVLSQADNSLHQIVNIRKVNHVQYLNKYFEAVNIKLKKGGVYILCAETLRMRRIHKPIFKIFFIGFLFRMFDYFFHRVWPRLPYLRKAYFLFWKNSNKRLSFAEVLGRLYSCGFQHLGDIEERGLVWIAVRKMKKPAMEFNVTYGPLVKLKRVGKNGKIIHVFKFRTMHPYSEFLQEFVYQQNSLDLGGKFKDDFRITTLGRFMRKLWIDEWPMLINVLKGEMKIVGVRPLSLHYYSLYPEDLQKLRIKYKPGLVPPFYADMPETLEEIVESERKYLEQYAKYRFITDLKYFFKAFWNIIFKRARSK